MRRKDNLRIFGWEFKWGWTPRVTKAGVYTWNAYIFSVHFWGFCFEFRAYGFYLIGYRLNSVHWKSVAKKYAEEVLTEAAYLKDGKIK